MFLHLNALKSNSMDIIKTVSASAGGTSLMSLFSYLISDSKHKNFREPEILGELIKRVLPDISKQQANISGWILHYGVGTVFTAVYDQIWEKTSVKPNIKSGAVLGALSGLVGIAVWRATIALHPKPPVKDYDAYYKHLLLAHIFFGIAAAGAYKKTTDIQGAQYEKNHNE
ncbi:hypothetical protein CHU_2072 [Cytophaga hutchinsonii ATCC 33406]|uniref:DUF2938 domain-containing protein n=2 Tax=Cytophaga hutchinsonii TaxID=985 RepID=A0A6N4SSB5_CYTH3|nr:hypothetical protein CHU_2072 [Cytophaga hutchinsonii ATCC 33406]